MILLRQKFRHWRQRYNFKAVIVCKLLNANIASSQAGQPVFTRLFFETFIKNEKWIHRRQKAEMHNRSPYFILQVIANEVSQFLFLDSLRHLWFHKMISEG